jgi:hypothetical protein
VRREAVKHQRISKPYEGLQPEEIDSYTGCSVCEQDQRTIDVSPLKPFKVCRLLAVELEKRLMKLIDQGESIKQRCDQGHTLYSSCESVGPVKIPFSPFLWSQGAKSLFARCA